MTFFPLPLLLKTAFTSTLALCDRVKEARTHQRAFSHKQSQRDDNSDSAHGFSDLVISGMFGLSLSDRTSTGIGRGCYANQLISIEQPMPKFIALRLTPAVQTADGDPL